MAEKNRLLHRPLTADELKSKEGEFNRDGRSHTYEMAIEVSSSKAPEVKTSVQREGDIWRIKLEIPDVMNVRRNGLTVGTLNRPTRSERIASQLEGFIPADAPVRIQPFSEVISPQKITLRGPKGNYTPLVVFPGDTRHILTDSSWPWRLTGLITTSDGKSASGVLVGDRLMLTAKHVFPSDSVAKGHWWMTFTPNSDSGKNPSAPFGTSFVSDLKFFNDESDNNYLVAHDFMLCRLYEPLGQRLGYLGATSFDDSWRGMKVWQNIGYPIDVGGGTRPPVQFNQSIEDDDEDDDGQILETEASLNHGNSGGPFFSWFTDGNVRLCSVVVGGLSFNGDLDNALSSGASSWQKHLPQITKALGISAVYTESSNRRAKPPRAAYS